MPSPRLMLTGGTGFIGSRLVTQAMNRGWPVLIVAHPGDRSAELTQSNPQLSVVRYALADVTEARELVAAWEPTACVHLAWNTTPGVYLETPENLDWLSWSVRLFEMLPKVGCRHIVGVGTCAEYDADYGFLREDTPLRPLTLYAASKMSLRLLAIQLARQSGVALSWARVFHLFGPGEHPLRLVPNCARTLLNGERFPATAGTQIRDYLHVDDVALGLLHIIESKYEGDINVCSQQPITIRKLLETIGNEVGSPELIDFGARPVANWDPHFLCGENARLRSLGWKPRHTIETAVRDMVCSFRSSRRSPPCN